MGSYSIAYTFCIWVNLSTNYVIDFIFKKSVQVFCKQIVIAQREVQTLHKCKYVDDETASTASTVYLLYLTELLQESRWQLEI